MSLTPSLLLPPLCSAQYTDDTTGMTEEEAEAYRKHKTAELKKRSEEEDIRPEQPLALRVNKVVKLAARVVEEVEESRRRFAVAFSSIESGVRADVEKVGG